MYLCQCTLEYQIIMYVRQNKLADTKKQILLKCTFLSLVSIYFHVLSSRYGKTFVSRLFWLPRLRCLQQDSQELRGFLSLRDPQVRGVYLYLFHDIHYKIVSSTCLWKSLIGLPQPVHLNFFDTQNLFDAQIY